MWNPKCLFPPVAVAPGLWRRNSMLEAKLWNPENSTPLSLLPTWLSSLRGPRTLDQKAERAKWSDKPRSSLWVCCCSVAQLCPTLCNPMGCSTQAFLFFTIFWSLLKLMSIKSVMPSNHLILCRPLLLLQSFPASGSFPMSQFFTSHGQSIRASASASVLLVNIQDWFSLGLTGWISVLSKTLKSLLQHHSSKASILRHSAFFMVQLSHPYMTTRKLVASIRCTFVGKMMSLLFNTLSSFFIAFLPRSKHLLISWLQSLSSAFCRKLPFKGLCVSSALWRL